MNESRMLDAKVIFYAIIIIIFMLPFSDYYNNIFPLDQFIFIIIIFLLLTIRIVNNRMSKFDLVYTILVLMYCLLKTSIYPIHLLSLIGAKEIYVNRNNFIKTINTSNISYFALGFTVIYSFMNYSDSGRLISTGIGDPNLSGFSILMLGIILLNKNKRIGIITLCLGLLTLSRSYLLGIAIFIFMYLIREKKLTSLILIITKNFMIVLVLSTLMLILIGMSFEVLHDLGKIESYNSGFLRMFSFIDYSNYFRFTVNNNLIKIYYNYPQYFLKGIDLNTFYELSKTFTVDLGRPYRQIKPHNFVFSYLQIYGFFALVIFTYLSEVIKLFVSKENLFVYLIILSYIIFLGVGVNSYWFYLSIFAMLSFKGNTNFKIKTGGF